MISPVRQAGRSVANAFRSRAACPPGILSGRCGFVSLAAEPSHLRVQVDEKEPSVNLCAHILRVECQSPQCRHKETNQRIVSLASVRDVTIADASTSEQGLSVSFSDGHTAVFHPQWVSTMARAQASGEARRFATRGSLPEDPEDIVPLHAQLWDADRASAGPPYMAFSDALAGGERTLAVLRTLREQGVVVLEGAGSEDAALLELAHSLGYPQRTHYGDSFHVKSKAVPDSLANTGHALTLHTDLAYKLQPPDYQLLHCQRNDATGGASILADGFKAALDLLREDPETYALLSSRLLEFTWQGRSGVMLRGRQPTLQLDASGRMEAVHLDSRNMSMAFAVAEPDPAVQQRLLLAVCAMFDRVDRQESMLRYMLRPGDIVAFDNRRMLHGRDAFDIETGERRLHGCYMERDVLVSKENAVLEHVDPRELFTRDPEFARSEDWASLGQAQE